MKNFDNFCVIKQLKTWLSINPVIGCPSECAYCIMHNDDINLTYPIRIENTKNLVEKISKHRLFLPHKTHLSIHNMTTDPFLPNSESKRVTFELLRELDSLGYENTVGLITKCLVNDEDVSFLESLSNIRIVVLVSYSEMPRKIEPIGNEQRIKTMEILSESKLGIILYWRPIVEGWNSDMEKIDKVLDVGENYADAFVISGLTFTQKIKTNLENKGINPPYEDLDPLHKKLPQNLVEKIIERYKEKNISVPLFRKTSCGVSYIEKRPDYNAHWSKCEKNCLETCPKEQKKRCLSVKIPSRKQVNFLLKNLGYDMKFDIEPEFVKTGEPLRMEEKTYLRQNLSFPVV